MYKAPEKFKIPEEVKDYLNDSDKLGVKCDLENWYITPEWANKFKKHAQHLQKLAENGEPWSQYHLGNMYFSGLFYSSEKDFENHYIDDMKTGSKWLEKAALQGFVAAVDNLVVSGISKESDRLREISKKVEQQEPEHIQQWEQDERIPVIMPSFFEKVWEIAYGKKS